MSNGFWNGDFYFNGIHSSNYKVCIVDVNSSDMFKQHGMDFNIELNKESSYGFNNTYGETNRSSNDITLQIARTDNKEWNLSSLSEIKKWLFQKNFKKFQTNDLSENGFNMVYYLKAVATRNFLTKDFLGYIEIDFTPFDSYVYVVPNNKFLLNNNDTKTLYNYSNLYDNYKPIIKIINNGDKTTEFTINNTTLQKSLILTGIDVGETIYVDCQMGLVQNQNGINRFEVLKNYNFIELSQGSNVINFVGNGEVEFVCEFPMIL